MCSSLLLQLKAAETLIDSASELVMDAANILQDVGDRVGMQRLEELAVTISEEGTKLEKQREAIGGGEVAA